ncbi:hypothetical protein ACFLQN_00940 [Candidatus Aenigmatarchaeota archaeon]
MTGTTATGILELGQATRLPSYDGLSSGDTVYVRRHDFSFFERTWGDTRFYPCTVVTDDSGAVTGVRMNVRTPSHPARRGWNEAGEYLPLKCATLYGADEAPVAEPVQ